MKKRRIFSAVTAIAIMLSAFPAMPMAFASHASDVLTDTNNFECVGTLTENFDNIDSVDELYAANGGEGALSGKWQLTEISHVGQGKSEITARDGGGKALNMVTTNGAAEPGGVDFVFDTPLTPDYILEVSYDLNLNNTSATVALTNGNYTNNESAGFCNMREDGLFRIFSGNGGGTGVEAYAGVMSGTITVKGVYNLLSWTYNAEVYQNETQIAGVTAGRMGPMIDGGPVCKPGTTYEKLSFFTQAGTAWVDNISVKVYKPTSEFALEMSETFNGKTAGAMSNVDVENGMGSWVANTLWGSGYEYAEYTNSNGNTDIGIRASGAWNRLQYVPGVNFNKLYDNNSEITVKFDFVTPDADPQGWIIMEWGDGFTNEHRNIPFFALNANGDKWTLTYPNDTAPGTEMFAAPLASLERGKTYTFEGTIYPAREMTSAVVKEGNTTLCKGSYKGGQWRDWTEGLNVHTMSVTNDGTPGVIFDNFSISSKEAPPYDPNVLVDKVDFSDCSSVADLRALGFLIVDSTENNISVGTAVENDPQSPSMCLGSAAHGANFPVMPTAAYEGAYRISYWAYDSGPAGLLVVDAPMILNSFDNGSLGLLRVESNRAYLGDTAITELQTGTWYRFENIIDLDARKVSAAVYTESGAQLGKTVRIDFKNFTSELSADLIDHFIGIRFRNWGLDTNVYIDNIEANRYFVTPTLTDRKISFSMFDGTMVSENEGVKPEVESIVLDFGASVTEESAAAGIHLSKSDGTPIAFTGSESGGKYFMKLDRLPEPNSSYLLTVDGSVETKDGKSLENSFSYTFTTGQGDFFCKLTSVQKDGEILENMTDVPGSSELTVELKYANPLLTDKKISCIVNYYDKNQRIIGKNVYEINADAGSAETMSLSTKAVPEECDSVRIFLWNDLETMAPYADSVSFVTTPDEADSSKTSDKSLKCDISYDFGKQQALISGVIPLEIMGDGIITVQVLKNGIEFEGLNNKTVEEKENAILFMGQQNVNQSNGSFSFLMGYDETDLPSGTDTASPCLIRVVTNQGEQILNSTMYLTSNAVYIASVDKINAMVADETKSDEEFADVFKAELLQMGLNCEPFAQTDLNGSTIKAYRAYLAENAMDTAKMMENTRIFKNFILMEAAKERKLTTFEPYKNAVYQTENGLILAYENVAKNQTIQEYFAQKFTEALLGSDEVTGGKDVTLDNFTKAWKIAVILTNARYGSGWGTLKSSLTAYGSEIGITGTKADSVYQELFGKDYTASSLKTAYDAAKEGNSQGGSSNGGGSSSNKFAGSGSITMQPIESTIGTPISKDFSDIDSVEWAAEAILALADKGIVSGKAENIFRPNDVVTREEFVKILVGAMGLGGSAYSNHFVDVEKSDWFCPWVNIAYENGICSGIGEDYFGVGSRLTRQDMAVLLNNALKLKGISLPDVETVTFEDNDEISDYASLAVSNLTAIGAVSGVSETRFEPLGDATRAQAAVIIYRVLDKLQ